jgi:hypothetical protein
MEPQDAAAEVVEETTEQPESVEPETQVDGLGDAGKKAIDAMKSERNEARAAQKQAMAELEALRAAAEGREKEHQEQLERQKLKDEAIAQANQRVLKAEVRAAAAGKLADPVDALKFIDFSSFEVTEDGTVDAAGIADAIDVLLKDKPYLSAQGGKRFEGEADGGPRNVGGQLRQLTQSDLDRMSPQEINDARKAGQLNQLLGVK